METRSRTWLAGNVRHVWDGGVRRFESSRETVRSATSIPSFCSSPWIRGAPQRIGLSHSCDESPELAAYARASRCRASGESGLLSNFGRFTIFL